MRIALPDRGDVLLRDKESERAGSEALTHKLRVAIVELTSKFVCQGGNVNDAEALMKFVKEHMPEIGVHGVQIEEWREPSEAGKF